MGKKGGKKKKKQNQTEAGVKMADEEKHVYLSMQVETLERELQTKAAIAEEALRSETESRGRVEQLEEAYQRGKGVTFAVTADMARQYKALQEELISKINSLETQLTEQKEMQDVTNHELDELIQDKDDEIKQKGDQIQFLKDRMNEMSQEFANMLNETLELMKKRVNGKFEEGLEGEAEMADCAQRLQEFNNKAYDAVSVSARAIGGMLGGGAIGDASASS